MEFGIDQLGALTTRLAGKRFALLAHPASVDRNLRHISVALREAGLRPEIILGPEHGYGGEAQDMISVTDARDRDGIVVRSLYGATEAELSPNPDDLTGLGHLAAVGLVLVTLVARQQLLQQKWVARFCWLL